jgi:hypothetical protein
MNIFLSYARKDDGLARDLAKRLRRAGFRVWDRDFDIEPGENWARKTGEALDAADFMVFLLTPGALASDIVHNDYKYAIMAQEFAHRVFTVFVGSAKAAAADAWMLLKLPHRRVASAKEFAAVVKEIQELCASVAHA